MASPEPPSPPFSADEIFAIRRPHSSLMTYYALASIITGPAFPFVILPLYFRYHTMRYQFTATASLCSTPRPFSCI